MNTNQTETAVITVTEAARALGIGRNLAYRLIQEGTIPSLRLGRRLVVPRTGFEAMLQRGDIHGQNQRGEAGCLEDPV